MRPTAQRRTQSWCRLGSSVAGNRSRSHTRSSPWSVRRHAGDRESTIHYEAARLLSARPTAHDAVAEHLLASEPRGEAWIVENVVAAARAEAGQARPARGRPLRESACRAAASRGRAAVAPRARLGRGERGARRLVHRSGGGCRSRRSGTADRAQTSAAVRRALNRAQRFAERTRYWIAQRRPVRSGRRVGLRARSRSCRRRHERSHTDRLDRRAPSASARACRGRTAVPGGLLGAAAFSSVLANEPGRSAPRWRPGPHAAVRSPRRASSPGRLSLSW